jgi:pimeloyl-ACP methyl ester carboxylesterase
MTHSRLRAGMALAVTAAIALASLVACAPQTSTPAAPDTAGVATELLPFYGQNLAWSDCTGGFQCAKATVPVDWATPAGSTITLSLIRHPANTTKRKGSLFVNPGGPGASGVAFVRDNLNYAVDKTLQDSFDVIGFDPRGVGESSPITCYPAAQMDDYLYGLSSERRATQAALSERLSASTDFAQACQRNSGDLLAHVDTVSVARDLDMLRAVVGDTALNYLGYSYGTVIGALYAQTFPTKVGHLVLDGAIDPTVSQADSMVAQAQGFEMALANYLTWCFSQKDCPFKGTVDTAKARIATLLAQVDAQPIAAQDGRKLGADTLVTAIIAPLYSKMSWKYLTQLFVETLANGKAETAFALADGYNERTDKGAYKSNQTEAFMAVTCLDSPTSDPATWDAQASELQAKAPLIGKYFTFSEAGCSVWPFKAVITTGRLTDTGPSPILVIGTTGDPATPIAWAEGLAQQITNGRLVRYTGDGHTGYNRGSPCVDAIVDDYLLGAAEPAVAAKC